MTTESAGVAPLERHVMQRATGGAAFPVLPPQDTAAGMAVGYPYPEPGMSLRDYFAVHGTEPGMSELVKVAGCGLDRTNRVYTTKDGPEGMHFTEWWQALTIETQCDLCARVRYAQADAMLRVRAA